MATKRVNLDIEDEVHDILRRKAFDLRVPMKRYVEALIEKDCGISPQKTKQQPNQKGK